MDRLSEKTGPSQAEGSGAWVKSLANRCTSKQARCGQEYVRKVGAVVTTHGEYGVFARACVYSLMRFLPAPWYIVLIINCSADPETRVLEHGLRRHPNVAVIRQQRDEGGLTGTWNIGIGRCKKANCDEVLLLNHDLYVDKSVAEMVEACRRTPEGALRYYGPLTNAPGPERYNQIQVAGGPRDAEPFELRDLDAQGRFAPVNGAAMAFPMRSLEANMFSPALYFDPSCPYKGNEIEWFRRFRAKGGESWVVPRAYVHHYKFSAWRTPKASQRAVACVYTTVWKGQLVPSAGREEGWDWLLFSDDPGTLQEAVQAGWQPMLASEGGESRGRYYRLCPSSVLPSWYALSIYAESRTVGSLKSPNDIVDRFSSINEELVCWERRNRLSVILRRHTGGRARSLDKAMLEGAEAGLAEGDLAFRMARAGAPHVRVYPRSTLPTRPHGTVKLANKSLGLEQ